MCAIDKGLLPVVAIKPLLVCLREIKLQNGFAAFVDRFHKPFELVFAPTIGESGFIAFGQPLVEMFTPHYGRARIEAHVIAT